VTTVERYRRYRSAMFERFTERARHVVVLAQDEARAFKHNYIGTEHILLGLVREEEGLAARMLESLGISVEEVRAQVARILGQGDEATSGQIPLTQRAKKVLELALREALSLGHNYIGTEHILLGLVRENEGVAARILLGFGVDAEQIRDEIIRKLSGARRRQWEPASSDFAFAPRQRPWQFRVVPWPREDAAKALNRLGAEGWHLAGVVPSAEGTDLIFQRPGEVAMPAHPRAVPIPSVERGVVDSGANAVRVARALSTSVYDVERVMSELGIEKGRNEGLSDEEIKSIAAARKLPITIRRPEEPDTPSEELDD
jgi:hypothetical protein